ncbi:hypothetical protein, partial [Nocardia brasiliensis]|uniref:hypothetical protein n=1 Tax=Nocardia brasiliensis TaxID=37326 RepID=UPI0024558D10
MLVPARSGRAAGVAAGARSTRTDSAVGHLTTKARAEWAAGRPALVAAPAHPAGRGEGGPPG